MKIYLIGMPGSGKSTIGRKLAKVMHYPFVDLDGLIEKEALMFIEEIFEKYGEKKFRSLETEALKSIIQDNAVIACGGGVVTIKENKVLMKGIKIYLATELDIIRERLGTDYVRPLLKEKSLDLLYQERYLKYIDFADAVISNDYDSNQTILRILEYLKKEDVL